MSTGMADFGELVGTLEAALKPHNARADINWGTAAARFYIEVGGRQFELVVREDDRAQTIRERWEREAVAS